MARSVANKKEQLPAVINFEEDSSQGFDGMTSQDLAIPFYKVLQKTSPILDDREDLKAGDIFNTVTEVGYKTMDVIPCGYRREFVEWIPQDQGGGLVGTHSSNSETVRKARRQDGILLSDNGTMLVETASHFVLGLVPDGIERAVLAMKSTSLKLNRRWNSLMMGIKLPGENGPFTPARYSHIYTLSSLSQKNDKGSWFQWDIELKEQVQDAGVYALAKEFATAVTSGEVQVGRPDDNGDEDIPF